MTTIQSNLQIQCNPYQTTNGILHRIRPEIFTICVETQTTPNSQSILRKKNGVEGIRLSDFQTIPQSYSNQESIVLAQKVQDRMPRDKPMHIWAPNL